MGKMKRRKAKQLAEKTCKPKLAGTRYQGFKQPVWPKVVEDADAQVPKLTRTEKRILKNYYAREHQPVKPKVKAEESAKVKVYLDKDGDLKVGKKWAVCRQQLLKPATDWRYAKASKHHIDPIEPKTQAPWPNMRANMDFEGMGQMNRKWEQMGEKNG